MTAKLYMLRNRAPKLVQYGWHMGHDMAGGYTLGTPMAPEYPNLRLTRIEWCGPREGTQSAQDHGFTALDRRARWLERAPTRLAAAPSQLSRSVDPAARQ